MDIDLKMFAAFYAMIIAIFIMSLFLRKYYPLFDLKDKIIIEYLGIIMGIGVLIFFGLDYPSSNSFFLFMHPFFILIGIYKLIKLHRLKDNTVVYSLKDNLVIKSLQSLGLIGMAIGFYITNKSDILFIAAIPLIYVAYTVREMARMYCAEIKVEG